MAREAVVLLVENKPKILVASWHKLAQVGSDQRRVAGGLHFPREEL